MPTQKEVDPGLGAHLKTKPQLGKKEGRPGKMESQESQAKHVLPAVKPGRASE